MADSRFAHLNPTKDEDGSLIVAEYEGWKNGERVRLIDDDESNGGFAGDEGPLKMEIVGSPEYGNERINFSFEPDGYDAYDCDPDNIEAA